MVTLAERASVSIDEIRIIANELDVNFAVAFAKDHNKHWLQEDPNNYLESSGKQSE